MGNRIRSERLCLRQLEVEEARALLADLLLHANAVVPVERLIDDLWGASPPATVAKSVQVYVSRLRKQLGEGRLVTRPPGYLLRVDPSELDVARFDAVKHGAVAVVGDAAESLTELTGALAAAPVEVTGIGHIRGHETDRIRALVDDIEALGGAAVALPDGIRVEPAPLTGGPWRAFDDHRIATAGAVIGLRVPGVEVDDIGATAKTIPEFPQLWAAMLG